MRGSQPAIFWEEIPQSNSEPLGDRAGTYRGVCVFFFSFFLQVSIDTESSADKDVMAGLLTETFSLMKKELDSLKDRKELQREKELFARPQDSVVTPEGSGSTLSSPQHFGDEQTLALLEQYSELLLQAVERRMDKKL